MPHEYVEVVVFALNPGVSRETFLCSSQISRDWYGRQPGFLSSELIEGSEGQWVGILHWESRESAESAQGRLMEEVDMSEFFAAINPDGTIWVGGLVAAREP